MEAISELNNKVITSSVPKTKKVKKQPKPILIEEDENVWIGWTDKSKDISFKTTIKGVGDGEQKRDFTHVDDIVDGLYKIGIGTEKHKDAWELGTGKNHSINEVANMFVKKFNCELEYIPDQKGNYRETLRENNDAIYRLGWNPSDKLKQYIQSL